MTAVSRAGSSGRGRSGLGIGLVGRRRERASDRSRMPPSRAGFAAGDIPELRNTGPLGTVHAQLSLRNLLRLAVSAYQPAPVDQSGTHRCPTSERRVAEDHHRVTDQYVCLVSDARDWTSDLYRVNVDPHPP